MELSASSKENLLKYQEYAVRGLENKLDPEKRSVFDELRRRGLINPAMGDKGLPYPDVAQSIENAGEDLEEFLGVDPKFSQKGVDMMSFRAGLSRMDTPEERAAYLTKSVGKDGHTVDKFGNLALTPEGATRLGMERPDKPVIIDEKGASWSDIADLQGDAPAILGGTVAGMLTGGTGFVPGVLAVGAGTALGKGMGEAEESLRGENLQSLPEVAEDVATTGAEVMLGEGLFRGFLAPIGRK